MTLESRFERYRGRPAYHIIVTAWNSKFFNKIYKVDGRIDSWVDAETMSTLAYESDVTERGRKKIKRYHIYPEKGVVIRNKNPYGQLVFFNIHFNLRFLSHTSFLRSSLSPSRGRVTTILVP